MAINLAPDAIVRFVAHKWQKAHDDKGPTRYQRMRPACWGHDHLPHPIAVSQHGVYLVSSRRPDNDSYCETGLIWP